MAKKKKKEQESRADQVRSAVDQAFHQAAGGAQLTRERAQELGDELAAAASRVRDALDELRPPSSEDLKEIVARLDALEQRVAALEKPAPARRRTSTARSTAAVQAAARKSPSSRTTTADKPAARKAAADKPAAARAKPAAPPRTPAAE